MKRYVAVTVAALLLTACAGNGARDDTETAQAEQSNPGHMLLAQAASTDANGPGAKRAQQAINEAEAAAEKADAVGYLWRDTEALIEEARKAATAREYEKAVQLADEARRQSEQAYRQYLDQRDAATRE